MRFGVEASNFKSRAKYGNHIIPDREDLYLAVFGNSCGGLCA